MVREADYRGVDDRDLPLVDSVSLLCRLRRHRWMRFMPSWGTFRYCARCNRVQRAVVVGMRWTWKETTWKGAHWS